MKRAMPLRMHDCSLVLLAIALWCGPADAHLDATGMGPVYDGLMHFLTSPEDLVPALALALLAGLRGAQYGRRAMFTLPVAWLLGSLFGLTAATASVGALGASFWFLLLGSLVVADAQLSLRSMTALGALLGLVHGYLNGTGMGLSVSSVAAALGLACCSVRTGRPRRRARRSTARVLGTDRRACRRQLDCRERPAHARLVHPRGLAGDSRSRRSCRGLLGKLAHSWLR